ncbi:YeeE/YedE family protein [Sinimarinibacterium thermocellulolyticum]|uniref:YeeE/YedE family protein n=1 Tax=Sinimarinibacterium thermocellulolyticum TaxID=3170016 RepID=A0ABV2ABU6_9GAMM
MQPRQPNRYRAMTATPFTPGAAILGGLLIGLAVVVLAAGTGRVAGISGIAAGALGPKPAEGGHWRWAFLIGLVVGGLVYAAFVGPVRPPSGAADAWLPVLIGAGLVGFGTRMGSGCTSGHGICGLSRGSMRSLVATAVFMSTGIATVFVARHLL